MLPHSVLSLKFTPYDYEFQLQDFQYFVVIDFEATCPHPQEIIEFPSMIMNSMAGQLEACFLSYVRPTCITDFCKDLTGIQKIQVCQLSGSILSVLFLFFSFFFV